MDRLEFSDNEKHASSHCSYEPIVRGCSVVRRCSMHLYQSTFYVLNPRIRRAADVDDSSRRVAAVLKNEQR